MAGWLRLAPSIGAPLVAAVVVGLASSLATGSASLGAAVAPASPCASPSSVSVTPIVTGSTVTSVSVGNLPASCGGLHLYATVANAAGTASGVAIVPSQGGSLTVSVSPSIPLSTSNEIDVAITP